MEKMRLGFLLLIGLSGDLAQTSLEKKVFVFPKRSDANYVVLRPTLEQPLRQFTLCLRYFTDLTEPFALFSMASRRHDNEILLQKQSSAEFYVWVGSEHFIYRVPDDPGITPHWKYTCLTWNSTTGIVQLWVDGWPLPRKGVAKGHQIPTELSMMLGQDQDSFGGSLDAKQSFVGEMAEVYLWDTVLPAEWLRRVNRDPLPSPLVNWAALNFEIRGNVAIEHEIRPH